MTRLSLLTYSLAAALLCYGVFLFLLGPCLTAIAETYDVPLGRLGLIFTFFSLGLIPSVLISGYLAEVIGRRFIILAALLLLAASSVLFAAVPSFGPHPSFALALGISILIGLGGGGIETITNVVIADDNHPSPGFALNASHAFFAVGAVLGPLGAAAVLRAQLPWQLGFYGASALFIIVFFLLLPQPMPASRGEPFTPGAALGLLRSPLIWLLLGVMALYVGTEVGLTTWVSPLMENVIGSPRGLAGTAVSAFWLLVIVGRLGISPAAARFRPAPLILILASGSALAGFALAFSRTAVECLLASAAAGLFMSGIFALIVTDAAHHFPTRRGPVFGLMFVGIGLGALIFPALMGLVADRTGLRAAMLIPPALLLPVVATYLLRRTR